MNWLSKITKRADSMLISEVTPVTHIRLISDAFRWIEEFVFCFMAISPPISNIWCPISNYTSQTDVIYRCLVSKWVAQSHRLYYMTRYHNISPSSGFQGILDSSEPTSFPVHGSMPPADSRRRAVHGRVPSVCSWGPVRRPSSPGGHDLSSAQPRPRLPDPDWYCCIWES